MLLHGDGKTLMDNSCGYSERDPWDYDYFQPQTIISRTETVEIYFHTDKKTRATGWSLNWTAVTPPSMN